MTALLNNRYRILKVLGAGGFGITSVAEDTHLPSLRRCVVKELKPATDDPRILQIIRERFQKEAATLEMLGQSSRQIPGLFAYFSENERFYLVQELVDGPTLTQYVTQNGLLGEEEARRILISLLSLLETVHGQGIIHRDIKPDNILLRRQDNQPVLIDFGAVKETVTSTLDSAGRATASIVIGTPGFIPLEQAAGRPLFSSDLYSLGLTIVFLLTGKIPQELSDQTTGAINWRSKAPAVSHGFAAVINKAIEPDWRTRYKTAREMLDALRQLAARTEMEWNAQARQVATPPPVIHFQASSHTPTEQERRLASSETERWTAPPALPSQPMPHPVPETGGGARDTQMITPPPIIPSQAATPPPSQAYSNPQPPQMPPQMPPPMPPSAARQAPQAFAHGPYPTPQQPYPTPQQFPSGGGFAPAPIQKKGMGTAAKVVLVVVGLGVLGFIGLIVLGALIQLSNQQTAQQSVSPLPTTTPLAIASGPTPSQSYGQTPAASPQQTPVDNGLDVTGRWQFYVTMLDSETMSDVMDLRQNGTEVIGTDTDGETATGTLRGNKISLAYKQPLSAADRSAMGSVFGNITSLIITISGTLRENQMHGTCGIKTDTGVSINGLCKWSAVR